MVTKDSLQAPQPKPAKAKRYAAATQAVRELTGPTTLTALVATAQKLFVAAGGKGDQKAMVGDCKAAIRSGEMFGLVTVKRNEITVTPVAHP